MRKIKLPAKTPAARKTPKRRKSGAAAKSAPRRQKSIPAPVLAGARPPPGKGRRGEQGHLAYLLRQAQAATRLTLERQLAELGVTPPQFAVLTMLRAYPGLSGADLARVALLTPQTVHGRVLQWTLTCRGATLLDKSRRPVRALERRLIAGLGAKAQATVRRWLSKIAADLAQDG